MIINVLITYTIIAHGHLLKFEEMYIYTYIYTRKNVYIHII